MLNEIHERRELMTDTGLLRETIEKSGISVTFIAKSLGISRTGLYKKLNGKTEFKVSEISKMKDILNITPKERDAIFFSKNVN